MSTVTMVVIVVAVIVAAALVAGVLAAMRRRRLQQRFGPEYGRLASERDSKRKAEAELTQRERRVRDLDIRPLTDAARAGYADQWAGLQERFVDAPADAVAGSQLLVAAVMTERGYPAEEPDQILADLSVEHASTLDSYRAAEEVSRSAAAGTASTEDLRQAMIHYRVLFADLLGGPADAETAPATTEPAPLAVPADAVPADAAPADAVPADDAPADAAPADAVPADAAPADDVPADAAPADDAPADPAMAAAADMAPRNGAAPAAGTPPARADDIAANNYAERSAEPQHDMAASDPVTDSESHQLNESDVREMTR
jgi:hypothetical protein